MRNYSSFKSGLANTAHELRAYRGRARLTMTGDLWAQLLLGLVDMVLDIERHEATLGSHRSQIDTLDRRISLLVGRVKALEPAKKAKKRKAKRVRK